MAPVRGPALLVAEGELLPAEDVGADVWPNAIVAAEHTTVASMSTVLFMELSCGKSFQWDGRYLRGDAQNRKLPDELNLWNIWASI